ncbi:MAG: hypothetical protein AUJ49_01900 [Desulfovibrionaceae bacterium CG1_02_65_16]|nr:MAG: hypothetical protein AUJ49_01900 [Desulfovibrionaceae bacterium CG1_02_65_16]
MSKRFAHILVLAIVLAVTLAALPPTASAQADELTPQKRADIERLFKAAGSGALAAQLAATMTRQTMNTVRAARKDIPARKLAIIEREMITLLREKLNGPGGMLDRLAPLYAATYTQQEIRDMLAFYESPTGRKVVATTPQLMIAGQKIGADMTKELLPELKKRLTKALAKDGEVLDKLPE